jgi:hypothetical protein
MIIGHKLLLSLFIYIFTIDYMPTMNKKHFYLLIFIFGITAVSLALPPPPPPTDEPGCWPPPCVPIDGGISLLIAAGAIYGGRKLYSKQKDKNAL